MKIQVMEVSDPWRANSSSDALYTIAIKGYGEPQKTFDQALAVKGVHEAEVFEARNGKEYWRSLKLDKESSIKAMWAIGKSVELFDQQLDKDAIEEQVRLIKNIARVLYRMVGEVVDESD